MKKLISKKRIAVLSLSASNIQGYRVNMIRKLQKNDNEVKIFCYESHASEELKREFQDLMVFLMSPPANQFDIPTFCSLIGSEIADTIHEIWPFLFNSQLKNPYRSKSSTQLPMSVQERILLIFKWMLRIKGFKKMLIYFYRTLFALKESGTTLRFLIGEKIDVETLAATRLLQMNTEWFQAIESWADCVYVCDLEPLFAGVMLKKKSNALVIYDVQEALAHQWADGEKSSQWVGFFYVMEKMLLKFTDIRIAPNMKMIHYLTYTYATQPWKLASEVETSLDGLKDFALI